MYKKVHKTMCVAKAFAVLTGISGNVFAPEAQADPHNKSGIEEILIVAHPLSAEGLAQPAAVLEGKELSRNLGASIGATVENLPGVHSQSFGEAVGRPVIHGLSGPRVRVMEDRIDTLDVSVTSTDHSSTVEPFIADKVEVLKGASTLLYGSGAIGGVVDVHTGRIPHSVPKKAVQGRAEFRYGDNADERVGAIRLDGGSGNFAWHVDGFGREANEYEIPGFVESDILRASEGEGPHGPDDDRDKLPGSQRQNEGGALGFSYITDRGFVGLAVSRLTAEYGLPGGHEHDDGMGMTPAEPEGNPVLDLEQTRVDIEAARSNPFGELAFIKDVNFRFGINDYEHTEFEPDGEVGTVFENDAWEARVELLHKPLAAFDGAFGLQVSDREFSVVGEEAFLSPVDSQNVGLFWVGERQFDAFELETGLRVEYVEHDPSGAFGEMECDINARGYDAALPDQNFSTFSTSLGLIFPIAGAQKISVQTDYASRAPAIEELYSCGPHLATQTFEVGNPDLDKERAFNTSLSYLYETNVLALNVTAYHIEFSDYIFQQGGLLADLDDLPALVYQQSDATFTGVDVKLEWVASTWQQGELKLSALFDTVRAQLDGQADNDVPRTPAMRYGAGVEVSHGIFNAVLDYRRVARQDDVADFDSDLELPTEGYDDVSLYLSADVLDDEQKVTVFLQGKNLTDDEQRNHLSFIKDVAPQPGRSAVAGVQLAF